MPTETLIFDVVSPEKLLFSKPVTMVTVPGTEGDFGVLPGHAPVVAAVRAGVIEVYQDNVISERLFVAGGFAEVSAEGCTVLAEEALPVADLDKRQLEETINVLQRDLAQAKSDAETQGLEQSLTIARAKLEAVA